MVRVGLVAIVLGVLVGLPTVQAQEATPVGSPQAQTTITFTSDSRDVGTHEWTVEITNVLTAERVGDIGGGSDSNISIARGKYVMLNLTILNLGKKEDEFPFDTLKVIDSQDREFSYDFGATFDYCYYSLGEQIMSRLQPSLPYEWGIVFDVATDSEGIRLTNEAGEFVVPLVFST